MGRLFEVKEFDKITCNPDYRESVQYRYLEEKEFCELIAFLHEFFVEGADALDFMEIGYRRGVGDVVLVKNYVGLIQLKSGFQLQILPKISFGVDEGKDSAKTKKVFLRMLSSIKDFPGREFLDASVKADRMNLYELFINMYLKEVGRLITKGVPSDYVAREENLLILRGKLLVKQQISINLAHQERFYVLCDEFDQNRPENRLVKATLLKLQKLTRNAENAREIRRLLIPFRMVEASKNYEKDFSRVVKNRSTKDYGNLMKWSGVFLMNRGLTVFSGSVPAKAILFPMESVYESYVAQQIKRVFCARGWEVLCQDNRYSLFVEPKRQFSLRPYLVLMRGGRTVILDTKWKKLKNKRAGYGISQSYMYQMYA
ncbi:MAG: McrC family protein, partial [Lachnospiraceae bacterium]|nr:McrC family protein [Lachnospiraceae bacterium]